MLISAGEMTLALLAWKPKDTSKFDTFNGEVTKEEINIFSENQDNKNIIGKNK